MSQEISPIPPVIVDKPKKGHGCLYAALIVGFIFILFILAASLGLWFAAQKIRDTFTDTAPMPIPAVAFSPDAATALQEKVKAFQAALDKNEPVPPLTLSENDLNTLIQIDPNWSMLRDRIHISIKGNDIGGAISFPLSELGLRIFKGRYLNGAATFSVFLRDNVLHVYLRSLEVKGKAVPDALLSRFRSENLARQIGQDPARQRWLDRLESIDIKDGAVVITPKSKKP